MDTTIFSKDELDELMMMNDIMEMMGQFMPDEPFADQDYRFEDVYNAYQGKKQALLPVFISVKDATLIGMGILALGHPDGQKLAGSLASQVEVSLMTMKDDKEVELV